METKRRRGATILCARLFCFPPMTKRQRRERRKEQRIMAAQLNQSGLIHARQLIKQGDVNAGASWDMTPDDENAIMGDQEWSSYSRWFLGKDAATAPEMKAHWKFPFGKDGKVYRSALTAIRQRAGQMKLNSIFAAAGALIAEIDAKTQEKETPQEHGEILGVDVFRPGTWHGRTYTNEDMDVIAENSNAMLPYFRGKLRWDFEDFAETSPLMQAAETFSLKIGHTPASSFFKQAALGISARYYTKILPSGEKRVFADFRNVPDVLCKAIANHFPERSVEKYAFFKHPDTHELIPDVISAVAFLGAVPPEVKALADDYKVLFDETHTETPIELFNWVGVMMQPVAATTPGQALTPQEETSMNPEMIQKMKQMFLDGKTVEELQAAFPDVPPGEVAKMVEEWQKEPAPEPAEESAPAQKEESKDAAALHPEVLLGILSMFVKGKKIEDIRDAFPDVEPKVLVELIEGWQHGQNAAAFKKSEEADAPQEQMQASDQPQVFSQDDVKALIEKEKANIIEQFAAQLKDKEEAVRLIAQQKRHGELARWYDDQKRDGLPASFDSFNPVAYMESLGETKQVFSEGQQAQSPLEVFQAVLSYTKDLLKVVKAEKAPDAGMGNVDRKALREKAIDDVMKEKQLEKFQAMKVVAEAHPEWF